MTTAIVVGLVILAIIIGYMFARDAIMSIHAENVKTLRSEVEQVKSRLRASQKKNDEIFQEVQRFENKKQILEFELGLPTSASRVQRPAQEGKPARRVVPRPVLPSAMQSEEEAKAVGDWLVKSGKISLEQLGKAMERLKNSDMDLIQACQAMAFIDARTAEEAREQAKSSSG